MIHEIVIPTPFAVGNVNAFLVKGDALSLFDAGPKTPEAYEALKFGIKEAGYTFNDIEQVILTHHHPDHAGWVEAFDRAEILGHPYNDFWLTRDQRFFNHHDEFYYNCLTEEGVPEKFFNWLPLMKRPLVFIGERPLDKLLVDGDELPGHPGWVALETLGHAQSHLAFWHEQNKEMIGGDLVLGKVSSNPLIEPPFNEEDRRPRSLLQYNASLKKVATLPVETIYAGHGEPVKNVQALIKERLAQQHERAMKVYSMLADGPKTIFELTTTLFPEVYKKELGLTLSETIGQIDYLVDLAMVTESRQENSVLLYEKK